MSNNENIVWHDHHVTKQERSSLKQQKPCILWFTGLSGSGPAYIYLIIEAMVDAGVKVGLPRELSLQLTAQTVLGSAKMVLETGEHPAKLREMVTTPGGVTINGIIELEEGKIRATIIRAVARATERARELLMK